MPQEAVDAARHVDQRLNGVGYGVQDSLQGFGQRRHGAQRLEHQEQVHPEHAAGSLDDHLALERLHVPGELELAEPIPTAHLRPPFVVGQVGVAAQAGPVGFDVLDGAEERLEQVQRVHAQVAERVAGRPILRRQGAARIGRIGRAAQDIDGDHPAKPSLPDRCQSPPHLGVKEQRVVDACPQPFLGRQGFDLLAVAHFDRQRLLHQHVAAQGEGFQRHGRVSVGRREDVDAIGSRLSQRRERGVGRDAKPLTCLSCSGLIHIVEAQQLYFRHAAQSGDMELADVTGAGQPDSDPLHADCSPGVRGRGSGVRAARSTSKAVFDSAGPVPRPLTPDPCFCAFTRITCALTWATFRSQVSARMASLRCLRRSEVSLLNAAAIPRSNSA